MTRRSLVALVNGGGNVPPELHAVRRLVERGHAVTVLVEDSVARDAAATGASISLGCDNTQPYGRLSITWLNGEALYA